MTDLTAIPTDTTRPTLMLVDGFGLIFRAYHALPPTLATASGEQTNAVFGFTSMLLDVIRSQQPDHAIIALETGKTFRHDLSTDYKANRAAMPEDMRQQIARVREIIAALNIPIEMQDGFEADDIIGSLSSKCTRDGNVRVLVVTGDTDLLQLVDDEVFVILPGSRRFGELRIYDRGAVLDRYGFGPEFVPDYKALVGDTSDNIPGVPGIGDKTAKSLIIAHGSIENMLDHLDEVTPNRARQALEANQEQARKSKHLATIVRDLDLSIDFDHSAIGNFDRDRCIDLFRELEFRNLVNRLPEPIHVAAATTSAAPETASNRSTVRTVEQLGALVERMKATKIYALDVETTGTDPMQADLVGIAIAVTPHESYYIPVGHNDGEHLDLAVVRDLLKPVLADASLTAYTHHGKYDLQLLRRNGLDIANLAEDSMIAAYLLGETSIRLKDLAFTKLGIQMTEITELIGTGRNQLTMNLVDDKQATEYAGGDVESTYALVEYFRPQLAERGLAELYHTIEMPLVPVLVDMERAGVAIDNDDLAKLSAEISTRMTALEREIYGFAGREFNINSTRQLASILFEELKLPSGRRTKTGYSVDSSVLENVRDQHPIVDAILEYRTLGKLISTYVDALPTQINPMTGRIHTSFNQTIAATGRLSSINPNLQNIPVRTELGRRVRHAFIADHRPQHRLYDDAILLSADYSQIELRLLAHMCGDPFLVEAFHNGEDIHRATAAVVNGVELDAVTPDMRRVAKTVNFGLLYGMQAFGLARDTGLGRAEAQAFIDQYWARLPKVKEYFDQTLRFGATHGYVQTLSGRRRYLPDLLSPNGMRRLAAERMAVNMPVQGTAADIIKKAMIQLAGELASHDLRAQMILQVHDELVLEVNRPDLVETAKLVRKIMESAITLDVPLGTEVKAGPNWDDMSPIPGVD